jgi:hypothetical protein
LTTGKNEDQEFNVPEGFDWSLLDGVEATEQGPPLP